MKTFKSALRSEWLEEQMPNIIAIVLIIICGVVTIMLIGRALDIGARNQCLKWQRYEREYPLFKVSEQMNKTCSQYNIQFTP